MVKVKRIYDDYDPEDGYRVLVDRLWPRGVSKEKAHVDLWMRDIAPSTELRKWFRHDTQKWDEFTAQYTKEIKENTGQLEELNKILREHATVTFLYAARDTEHNDAVVLKQVLSKK